MEFLQLRYFFESANSQSFSKTAEKYMVPLSSVSASIKRLEKELGCTLFDRLSNKIVLNENGKKLQNSLCVIFDEMNNVIEQISPNPNDSREIKIHVCVLRREITDCIIKFKTTHPNISFKTIFDFTGSQAEDFDIIIDDKPSKYTTENNVRKLADVAEPVSVTGEGKADSKTIPVAEGDTYEVFVWNNLTGITPLLTKTTATE